MSNSDIIRSHREFKEMLDRVRTTRRINKKDNRDLSDTRLTLAIRRISNIETLLINADIPIEKKKWRDLKSLK